MNMQVPRIALGPSTFSGLLAKPAVPNTTIFFLGISESAGITKSLFYTFGTGVPERSCPFKPFFEAFMGDVQKQLKA